MAGEVRSFVELKGQPKPSEAQLLDLLERDTVLRRRLADALPHATGQRRSQWRLADIGLEDYGFALLSDTCNRLDLTQSDAWQRLFGGGAPRCRTASTQLRRAG